MSLNIIRIYGSHEFEDIEYKKKYLIFEFVADDKNYNEVIKNVEEFKRIFYQEKNNNNGIAEGLYELEKKSNFVKTLLNNDWDRNFFDIVDFYYNMFYTVDRLSDYKIFEN